LSLLLGFAHVFIVNCFVILFEPKLGHFISSHYQWQWNDENVELILWKLNSNLNLHNSDATWFEFKYLEWHSNILTQVILGQKGHFNQMDWSKPTHVFHAHAFNKKWTSKCIVDFW
jgi:hypothetical protein